MGRGMDARQPKWAVGGGTEGSAGAGREKGVPLFAWYVKEATVGRRASTRTVLQDIAGDASSGSLVGIMGPSGSGKTTLIECLSLRNRGFEGALRMHGKAVEPSFFTKVAVVHQDEQLFGYITPREHLLFHAITLAGPGMPRSEVRRRVESLIAELGLGKCAETLIGGNETTFMRKGLSGGERKRLAIATGLLSSPDLIFLDEPTSGLDSVMALDVLLSLHKVAQEEAVLVMASLHCPSSAMASLITHVLLLTDDGRLAYYGPMASVISHFESLGFRLPPAYNPFEFLLDLVSRPPEMKKTTAAAVVGDEEEEEVKGVELTKIVVTPSGSTSSSATTTTRSPASMDLLRERNARLVEASASKQRGMRGDADMLIENTHKQPFGMPDVPVSSWVLFRLNLWRGLLQMSRDMPTFILRVMACTLIGLMCGLLYLNQAADNWRNFIGLLFTVVCTLYILVAATQIWYFPLEWLIVNREYQSCANAWGPYLTAKIIFNTPFAIGTLALASSAYWMGGLDPSPSTFLTYVGVIAIFQQAATAMGFWCSSFSSNLAIGIVVMATLSAPLMVFSGLVYERSAVPAYLKWFEYISIVNHSFAALTALQLPILSPSSRSMVLAFTQIDPHGASQHVAYLAVLAVAFYFMTYVNLKVRAFIALRW